MNISQFILGLGLYIIVSVLSEEVILLNDKNTVKLNNIIDEELVSNIIYQLYQKKQYSKTIYLYIHSSGGDVQSGNQLIDFIQFYKKDTDLICINNYAASMAFAILQSCTKRYSTKRGVLMQHQIILKNMENKIALNELQTYMEYVNSLNQELINSQITRIGVNKDQFMEKTKNDWWLTAEQALQYKMIDKLVTIGCEAEYALSNYTKNIYREKYTVVNTYSNCPTINKPIHTKYI